MQKLNAQSVVSIITLILLFVTMLVQFTMASAFKESDIHDNAEKVKECAEIIKSNTEIINNIDKRVTTVETHYVHIKESLDRIENKIGD